MAKTVRDLGKDEKAFFLTGVVLLVLTLMDVVNMVVGNVKATLKAQIDAMDLTEEQLELADLIMWIGIFADVGVMVLAVLNAVRTLNVKNL